MAKRLTVGQARERWLRGKGRAVSGRLTFQLEKIYSTRKLADGSTKRYGPYGPYWYVYFWIPTSYTDVEGKSRLVCRYLGKPDKVDPLKISEEQLVAILNG